MSNFYYREILNSYFVPPWKPKVNIDEMLKQPDYCLKEFIENQIQIDIYNRKAGTKEEKEYLDNVKEKFDNFLKPKNNNYPIETLDNSKNICKKKKKKKKLTLAQQLLLKGSSKLSNEEMKKKEREKLARELIKIEHSKIENI
jgi:hypothetical protein